MKTLDAAKHSETRDMRVWLDGEEVTEHTYRARLHDKPEVEIDGWVDMYAQDEQGQHYLINAGTDNAHFAQLPRKKGAVRWEWKIKATETSGRNVEK